MEAERSAEETLKRLQEDVPSSEPSLASRNGYFQIATRASPGSDYRLMATVEKDLATASIDAQLLACPDCYFWSYSFELFEGIESRTIVTFQTTLLRLLIRDTRITQRRGLLFWSFDCDWRAEGKWKEVYGAGCFRFSNFDVPRIKGREAIYRAIAFPRAAKEA